MFLLIPEGHLNCFNGKAHFKFHYVSINSKYLQKGIKVVISFKFHYVSINSYQYDRIKPVLSCFKFHYVSINSKYRFSSRSQQITLNSIMFLLILLTNDGAWQGIYRFKFHYVSINSWNKNGTTSGTKNFKFHYVSINSESMPC